ncbi:TIGR03088 family PEP-CTERM/XrtA system glycosyltransferase [uncultured Lamprocystis sp.]|jgi:sugar transferase (PEP-CTERM/EpsH1 system associated)|uniref:TIGR03088 family PEP-CTERM/XrtA system glycosyltransferase n=1 Tax=uncultured Lamprocystis sp. TaxID=543132 RepID=UPI0025E208F4|nr:TIGR03088 family PEP-CTERM/XrtA system glycosyltransferase [uncultured Lamprocystis sp.]
MIERGLKSPRIVHVVYGFGTGGLENGLVNIINRTPPDRYRHAILCFTDAGLFASRVVRHDVPIVALRCPAGHSFSAYVRLWSALRAMRPAIVHTRNLATLEAQIPALFLPGVKRVHGEHGRDVFDLEGNNRKYNVLRRLIRPIVHRYVAVSKDLAAWLESRVRVPPVRIRQIYNGVDADQFSPTVGARTDPGPSGFLSAGALVIGTVGRLVAVKDQRTLLFAFADLVRRNRDLASRLRLVVVGEGGLRHELEQQAAACGVSHAVWFTGDRSDVADLMRLFDLFVLPSLGEGVSNIILEAMATGVPVIATRVGGNPELVTHGRTGALVSAGDAGALASAMYDFITDEARRSRCGAAARAEVMQRFDWKSCVDAYLSLYDELLAHRVDPTQPGISRW